MKHHTRSHWSVIGYDENGDMDGEVCRCDIGGNHPAGQPADRRALLSLLDDLIRDNNLTCDPHPDNPRCMCSTARALRVVAGEEEW